jgi:hypothetical protein
MTAERRSGRKEPEERTKMNREELVQLLISGLTETRARELLDFLTDDQVGMLLESVTLEGDTDA